MATGARRSEGPLPQETRLGQTHRDPLALSPGPQPPGDPGRWCAAKVRTALGPRGHKEKDPGLPTLQLVWHQLLPAHLHGVLPPSPGLGHL